MRKILAPIVGIGILFLLIKTNAFQTVVNIAIWLIRLDLSSPNISITGQIIVKVLTFLITYALVGAIFNAMDWFDSNIMHVVYVVVSTILSFVFCHIFHFIEANALWIGIGIGTIAIAGVFWVIVARHKGITVRNRLD